MAAVGGHEPAELLVDCGGGADEDAKGSRRRQRGNGRPEGGRHAEQRCLYSTDELG